MDRAEFIQSKKKRKRKAANLKPVENTLPKDLADRWGAVKASATAFNVIQKGTYGHEYLEAVRGSLHFLQSIHDQCLEHALEHPEAALIPDLKSIIDGKAKQDGQTPA